MAANKRPKSSLVVRLAAVASALGLFAFIVLSPMVMFWLVGMSPHWPQFANVGQAYGGVSALLSGLAFYAARKWAPWLAVAFSAGVAVGIMARVNRTPP